MAKICFIIVLISVDNASVSWVLFYKILKAISVPLKINYLNHSFIPLSPPLCEGKGKDFPKMGYKRRDVKQSIKEECQKEVAQKGKWEFFVCRKR